MTTTVVRPETRAAPKPSPALPAVSVTDPFTLCIFGATGDLAARKLLPALYALCRAQYFPRQFAIFGIGRRDKRDDEFRADVRTALSTFRSDLPAPDDDRDGFLSHIYYQRADLTAADDLAALGRRMQALETERKLPGNRMFYLAIDPEFFCPLVNGLAATGLIRREIATPWTRVVIEKPFGHDLASAMELDEHVLRFLRPDQVYRIDHYLGKETVQNLLAFRFGNAIFEPLFDRQLVDHVQITVAETVGMEGRRGEFYDHAGALRDVVQNHMLQLLALVAMDPPATLRAGDISDAKLKVLRTLVPPRGAEVARHVVRGQYDGGALNGQAIHAYHDENGVARDSTTETYVALRTEVESWRWAGVPFLLRTGKRLAKRMTEVAVQFKLPPLRLFQTVECAGDFCDLSAAQPTVLVFRIQPDEGISLSFAAKRPGMRVQLEPVHFEFDYDTSFGHRPLPEAYERLLLDALRGDATLFMRSDELEAAWEFVTPILEAWRDGSPAKLPSYAAGSWGPAEADELARGCSRGWRHP